MFFNYMLTTMVKKVKQIFTDIFIFSIKYLSKQLTSLNITSRVQLRSYYIDESFLFAWNY